MKTMVAGTVVVSWLCRFMYPWRKAGRPSGDSRKHAGGFFAAVASVVSVFVFSSCRAAAVQVGHAIYFSGCTRPVMDYAWLTPLVAKLRKPGLRFQRVPLRGWLPDWDAVSLGSCGIASLPADADNGCLMYQSSA